MTQISNSEWEVMRVLWASEEQKSSDIIRILQEKFDWSPSTIKTLLGRLVDKKLVTSKRDGRAYLYRAIEGPKVYQEALIREDFDKICQRQHSDIIYQLLDDLPMTSQEVALFISLLQGKKTVESVACNCVTGQCACHVKGEMTYD